VAVRDKTSAAAVRFLKDGSIGSNDPARLAAACDAKVRAETQISTESSIRLGRQFVKQAKPHGGVLYCTALRALGWAQLVAGRYREAEKNYLSARSLLTRDAAARARIDRVLIDVYMYLGRVDEAQRRARRALATFRRLKAEADTSPKPESTTLICCTVRIDIAKRTACTNRRRGSLKNKRPISRRRCVIITKPIRWFS